MWQYFCLVIIMTFYTTALEQCERLHSLYTEPEIFVRYQGADYEVVVQGAGGAARAESALLLALIRHVHRYTARMDPTEAYFCNVTKKPLTSVVLTPAAILDRGGCHPATRQIDPVVSFNAPAAAEVNLYFMARINSERCKNILSQHFPKSEPIKDCDKFSDIYNKGSSVVILARNETIHDNLALSEFEKRVRTANMSIEFITFNNDTSFRRRLFQLRNSNATFLFIDENLWADVPDIIYLEPPSCQTSEYTSCSKNALYSINAVRTGDGSIVMNYAPPIYKTFTNFSPDVNILRKILEYESHRDVKNIEEAACLWAMEHNNEFDKMYYKSMDHQNHIQIYLCSGDPYNQYYEKAAGIVLSKFRDDIKEIKYTMNKTLLNCADENVLKWSIEKLNRDKKVAGAVAWSWNAGVSTASNFAQYANLPLMLAGPASDRIVGQSTYATSGRFSDMAKAYQFFLSQCTWNRVAIISDDSYSGDFVEEISNQSHLNHKNVVVNQENMSMALEKLNFEDARIFIINTNCQLAESILSKAKTMFTPINNYIWIVRDLCVSQNKINKELMIYTIELTWRGGKSWGGSQELRNNLTHKTNLSLADTIITPGISFLIDALLQLGHGFAAFLRADPSSRYDLRGKGAPRKFHSAISALNISGVSQFLMIQNNSLNKPLIFVNKWQGSEPQTMAIWQVVNRSVVNIWQSIEGQEACYALLNAKRVTDKKKCIISSGDTFSPRCHDIVLIILGISLMCMCLALYIAQKKRRERLLAYNKSVLVDILETRHKNASALAAFLVDRGSIKLLHVIGSGSFGRVYFAELSQPGQGTLVVAAKEPHEHVTTLEENVFLREACVLARLEHNNVIKLMGVCLANGLPLMLMEHAIYLDLIRYLTERRHLAIKARDGMPHIEDLEEVSDANLTRWACEAATALEYLSMRRLVHRDVRAANCLLDKKRSLKLADFGLARELDMKDSTYMTSRKALFPVLWMAPESLEGGLFGPASDIWALGVLFLEIATMGSRPYGDWPALRVIRYVTSGGCPPLPPDCSLPMRKLLHKCWNRDPDQRITATQAREHLLQNPNIISPALLLPELPLIPPVEDMSVNFIS